MTFDLDTIKEIVPGSNKLELLKTSVQELQKRSNSSMGSRSKASRLTTPNQLSQTAVISMALALKKFNNQ